MEKQKNINNKKFNKKLEKELYKANVKYNSFEYFANNTFNAVFACALAFTRNGDKVSYKLAIATTRKFYQYVCSGKLINVGNASPIQWALKNVKIIANDIMAQIMSSSDENAQNLVYEQITEEYNTYFRNQGSDASVEECDLPQVKNNINSIYLLTKELTEEEFKIVVLRFVGGVKENDIAKVLKLKVKKVNKAYDLAINKIIAVLAEQKQFTKEEVEKLLVDFGASILPQNDMSEFVKDQLKEVVKKRRTKKRVTAVIVTLIVLLLVGSCVYIVAFNPTIFNAIKGFFGKIISFFTKKK